MSKHADLAPRKSTVLIIMDGVGVNPSVKHNAFALAHTPKLDDYFSRYPHTVLQASGRAVGLPDGQMGNSEVGHTVIGAGSVIMQDLVLIDEAIHDGSFYANEVLLKAVTSAANSKKPLHLLGLVSTGGVHSHTGHLLAMIDLCHRYSVVPIIHAITDGRDVAPKSALTMLAPVQKRLEKSAGFIATVSGRYYAMDRDHRWDRTELAWQAICCGKGKEMSDPSELIMKNYKQDITDEFIQPSVSTNYQGIQAGETVVCFNFRRDRPRQIIAALYQTDFNKFDRGHAQPVSCVGLTQYDQWFDIPYAFAQDSPKITLAEFVSQAGIKQFHCAETEKYAHVTFFLNGGHGDTWPGETHEIIDSPDVATYDQQPEMSAKEVADKVIDAIKEEQYGLIVVNFANGDMVGHTAVRDAVIKAMEVIDTEVGRVLDAAVASDYSVLLTSDHGNCDEMIDPITGEPHTQHTVYPVPCLIIDPSPWLLSTCAGLNAVAPTVLQLMGLQRPDDMEGRSLLLGTSR